MADALISPAVGGTMWVVSGGLIAYCARRLRQAARDDLVPMMGVLGAFIFAAQMINFSIPGTGSSGHLGGGLILAILLGPHAAFLVMASVLTVQAFFFADGGLLALGCNMFNLGFFPAFVAYPLIYRLVAGTRHAGVRNWAAAVLAAVIGLLLGALAVVLETTLSGISQLPFRGFALTMLPIHSVIGAVEGLATAAVVSFVARARPAAFPAAPGAGIRPVVAGLAVAALAAGGILGWFASTNPDGLEWSMARVAGTEEVSGTPARLQANLADLQEKTAVLPDYEFKAGRAGQKPWPAVSAGRSVAGLAGGLIVLGLAGLAGMGLRRKAHAGQ